MKRLDLALPLLGAVAVVVALIPFRDSFASGLDRFEIAEHSSGRPVAIHNWGDDSLTAKWLETGDSQALLSAVPAEANQVQQSRPVPIDADGKAPFLVRFTEPPLSRYAGGVAGIPATGAQATGQARLEPRSSASLQYLSWLEQRQHERVQAISELLQRSVKIERRLSVVVNAVSLRLTPDEADRIRGLPGVEHVERAAAHRTQTDFGPSWVGADAVWSGHALPSEIAGTYGEGVIIGVLDTGINVLHPSFSETDALGYTHTNPLGAGIYLGWCNPAHPNHDPSLPCNSKLIGLWDFAGDGPVDLNGHGSHVAATAAGNFIDIDWEGFGFLYSPTLSGVAPRASLVSYAVCDAAGWCLDEHVVAGIEQAAVDGVDVINESIGIGGDAFEGIKQQAYLGALEAGVLTVRATGNNGPRPGSVGPEPPWVLSVAATTHDREVLADAVQSNPGLADRVAAFSSRGPGQAQVFKPDLAAPGVDILAAIQASDGQAEGHALYNGTSMSSPHVAGAAALLVSLYPDWTAMEIASALRATAWTGALVNQDGSPAAARDVGNGRLDAAAAANAALVMNESTAAFQASRPALGGDPQTLNLPSLMELECHRTCTWQRTFRNPTATTVQWSASYEGSGQVRFSPASFSLEPGASVTVEIEADLRLVVPNGNEVRAEGHARWSASDGEWSDLRMPLLALGLTRSTARDPAHVAVQADASRLDAGQEVHFSVEFSGFFAGQHQLELQLPAGLEFVQGSATGGLSYNAATHSLVWTGDLGADIRLSDQVDDPVGFQSIRNFVPGGTTFVDWFIIGVTGLDYIHGGTPASAVWPHGRLGVIYPQLDTWASAAHVPLPGYAPSPGLIAPFWGDLRFGWQMDGSEYPGLLHRAFYVGRAGKRWHVWQWDDVTVTSQSDLRFTFQVWIELGGDDHRFVYGPGDWDQYSNITVGFQDFQAAGGTTLFHNGTGTRPAPGAEYRMVYAPEVHIAQFSAVANAPLLEPLLVSAELTAPGTSHAETAWAAVYVSEPESLSFSQTPSLAAVGRPMRQTLEVQVVDALGNRVEIDGVVVELDLDGTPGGLSGTLSGITEAGTVVFPDVSIVAPGASLRLVANAAGLEAGRSEALKVIEMAPCDLVTDIPQAECEALVDFALSTGVVEWSDNSGWLEPGLALACSRHGVSCSSGRVSALDLTVNHLVGHIPDSLVALQSLTRLNLAGNGLSGTLPAFLSELPALHNLALSVNHFTGALPSAWANMDQLRILRVSANRISGGLPPWIGNLSALEHLDLSQNPLGGSIPPELGNLKQLRQLWLRSAELVGVIPPEIGQLSELRLLALRGNALEGPLPDELGQLHNLETLFLYLNSLQGELNEQLISLPNLRRLDLYHNSFMRGKLPPSIAQMEQIRTLRLENTGLEGRLPDQIGAMTHIRELHLGGNRLHGFLPDDLGELSELRWLGLNNGAFMDHGGADEGRDFNRFFGRIPDSITQLEELLWMDTGGNCLRASGSTLSFVQQFDPFFPENQFCKLMLAWIEPESGHVSGGEHIELFGMEFSAQSQVEIGAQPCLSVQYVDENRLVCQLPPGNEGPADVLVRNADGTEFILPRALNYFDPNTIWKDRFETH